MSFHVRRKDREITDPDELRQVLKATKYVTVALCMQDEPYLVSLSHGYDEERNCIYFHCTREGKKLDYLKSGRVWGQALLDHKYAEGECTHLYASVHFSGKIIFINSLEEKHHALECMIRQLDSNPKKLIAGLTSERLNRVVVGRIDIEYMSGKKSKEITV